MWQELPITILKPSRHPAGHHLRSRLQSERGFDIYGLRDFEAGDSLRSLSRRHYIRTGDEVVIVKRPERNAFVLILLDISASERVGAGPSKYEASLKSVRLFGTACLAKGHPIQLLAFTTAVERESPVIRGGDALEAELDALGSFRAAQPGTDHREVMERAGIIAGRRNLPADLVCLVSDLLFPPPREAFFMDLDDLQEETDVIALVVRDRSELETPALSGPLRMRDAETGETFWAGGAGVFDPLDEAGRHGLDACVLMTSQTEAEWFETLSDFFLSRREGGMAP